MHLLNTISQLVVSDEIYNIFFGKAARSLNEFDNRRYGKTPQEAMAVKLYITAAHNNQ